MEVSLEIPCNYSSLLDLPEELVIMVLTYIPVSELLYTVCKICRGLKDVVRKMQSLWTIVEFDDSYTIDIAMMEMIVKNNQLVCLNLSNQNITFGSHRFTKLMLKLTPTIQELYVAETPLNNLAFVMSLRNLTTLDISGTSINDNQVVILSHASQLRHLYISFTKVTAATIADLSRNFKFLVIFDACQIYFMFTDICLIVSSCEQLRFLHVSFFSQFDIDQAVQYVNQQLSIERQLKLTVF